MSKVEPPSEELSFTWLPEDLDGESIHSIIFLVLAIFYESGMLMRETARVGRASAREAVKNELFASADKTDEAAYQAMLGGIIGGAFAIAGGIAGIGFATKAGSVYNSTNGIDRGNALSQRYTAYGQSARETTSGLGTLTQAIYDGEAQFTMADAERLKAAAAALQEVVDNWNDLYGSATAAGQRALEAIKDLIAALHATALAITQTQ